MAKRQRSRSDGCRVAVWGLSYKNGKAEHQSRFDYGLRLDGLPIPWRSTRGRARQTNPLTRAGAVPESTKKPEKRRVRWRTFTKTLFRPLRDSKMKISRRWKSR